MLIFDIGTSLFRCSTILDSYGHLTHAPLSCTEYCLAQKQEKCYNARHAYCSFLYHAE